MLQTEKTPPVALSKQPKPRSLMMLQRDVEFVPSTPQKGPFARKGPTMLARGGSGSDGLPERLSVETEQTEDVEVKLLNAGTARTRTRDEKKELLGTMLGNVDALVESVSRAGIWGLG
jgi:hypothetical protein